MNGWANRMDESGVRAVSEVVCGTQAEGLAGIAGINRICNK